MVTLIFWFFYREKVMSQIEQGTVKWFDPKKGWGFIVSKSGQELFVHYNDIAGVGFKNLEAGQFVQYEIEQGRNGEKAANVVVLDEQEMYS